MGQKRINFFYNVSKEYLKFAYMSILSVFQSHRTYEVNIYIGSFDIEQYDLNELVHLANDFGNKIHLLKADKNQFEAILDKMDASGLVRKQWERTGIHSLLVYSMFELLPKDVDKIIRIHCDTIVKSDLTELYFGKLEYHNVVTINTDYLSDVSNEYVINKAKKPYSVCEFFSMYNMERLINCDLSLSNIFSGIKYINENEMSYLPYRIQIMGAYDYLLSKVLGDDVYYCDGLQFNYISKENKTIRWSKYDRMVARQNATIIHYDARQPWLFNGFTHPLDKLWWSYAIQSPYYSQMKKKYHNSILKYYLKSFIPKIYLNKKKYFSSRMVYIFMLGILFGMISYFDNKKYINVAYWFFFAFGFIVMEFAFTLILNIRDKIKVT